MTMKHLFLSLTVFIFAVLIGGCNTMEGAGKDVERVGEEVQDAAD